MRKNKQHILAAIILIFSVNAAIAAETAATKGENVHELGNLMQWMFLGAIGIMTTVVGFVVMRTMKIYQDLLSAAIAKDQGREVSQNVIEALTKESWLDKLRFQFFGTGAVAIEKEADIMIDHPHDGIYELDNRLPPWWVSMFYATIIFAFGYIGYYHFFDTGHSQIAEYKESVRKADILKAEVAERQANLVNENNVKALTDPKALEEGKGIFTGKCAACHGQKGEGGIGPNMTDEYWLHGGSIKKVFTTIKYGVPDKGMISWQGQLSASEIQHVASYLLTLKGTTPPNPKAPQGDKYVPEAEGATDSTATQPTAVKKDSAKVGK